MTVSTFGEMPILQVADSDDDDDALLLLKDPNLLKMVAESEAKSASISNNTQINSYKTQSNSQTKTRKSPKYNKENQNPNSQSIAYNSQYASTLSPTSLLPAYVDSQTETQNMSKRAKYLNELMLQPTYPSSPSFSRQNSQIFNSQFNDKLNILSSNCSSRSGSNSPPQTSNSSQTRFYGLPLRVKELLKELRKIDSLYEWQDELLNLMHRKYHVASQNLKNDIHEDLYTNLLYLSPTSAGKTLVAELIILHCLLIRNKNAIFIMPFVSIVQEKVQLIAEFADKLNFHVEEYAGVKGKCPPLKRQQSKGKSTLYICTIEKAHSLVNSLIETERLSHEIGLVVADELHMIGDGPRGAIYEMILSKINYCSEQILLSNSKPGKQKHDKSLPIQIVATTATLDNKRELAQFMNAHLYERQFRPVELKEYIKLDAQIFEVDKSKTHLSETLENCVRLVRELDTKNVSLELKRDDPDGLIALIKECIPESSCLIFCSTKKNCENLASLLCAHLPSELKQYKRDLKLKLFNELREENANNICPILRQSLQYGIAYHHSGLTTEERQLIEQAYRDGVLCLLTCTSTLAAGVNLPAKRVIIRSPYVAMDFISTHQYRQMIGRAGRAGLIDSQGESFLIFKNSDRVKVADLISGPMRRCESSFQCDDSKAVRLLVLSLIGLNLTHLGSQILLFFRKTLFFMQQKAKLDETLPSKSKVPKEFELISRALSYLLRQDLIKINRNDSLDPSLMNETKNADATAVSGSSGDGENLEYLYFCNFEITKLGMAAIKGNIDLDHVHQLYADLKNGLKNMCLSNYMHLLYLCTPYDLVSSLNNVDFDIYARKYCNLSEDEIKCACLIGIKEEYIQKKRFQRQATNKKVNENVMKRFYLTLVIYELWKTNNAIWKVSGEFNLDRGFIQQIVQSAASFTSGVAHFCEHLDDLWPYKNLLDDFTKRLQHNCSSIELIPMLELDSVRLARAKQLHAAGFTTIELIAAASADEMSAQVKNLPATVAKRIIKSANKILKERIEVLQAEADNLLEQLNADKNLTD